MGVKDADIEVRLLTKWILTITWKAGGDGRVVLRRVAYGKNRVERRSSGKGRIEH